MPDVNGWPKGGLSKAEIKDHLVDRDNNGAWIFDIPLISVRDKGHREEEMGNNKEESNNEDISDNDWSDNGNASELSLLSDLEVRDSNKSVQESDDE